MKTNYLKLAVLGLMIMVGSAVNAQTTDTTDAGLNKDAGDGVSVKLIDNKGTIKYLQTNNGITSITSTNAGNKTTTSWQLGGTLINDTKISLNDGTTDNVFNIDGINFQVNGISGIDATANPTSDIAATAYDATGYTLLVRDEATGQVKKLLATELIQSGQEIFTAADDQTAYALTGSPVLPVFSQIWVYRNGAKLLGTTDYTVTGSTVTLTLAGHPVYSGDVIEVQYIK